MTRVLRGGLFRLIMRLQGFGFDRAFARALAHQDLALDALEGLQANGLLAVLASAASRNAPYQQILNERSGVDLRTQTIPALAQFPVLSKDDLANIASASPAPPLSRPILKRTSGSTGRPLSLYKQRTGLGRELAATWRSYGWYGLQPGDRNIRVWGRPLDWRKRLRVRLQSVVTNTTRISAFDVTEQTLGRRLKQINRTQPVFLHGYSSSLRDLASYAIAHRVRTTSTIRVVIATAEPYDEDTRALIEAAFHAPCRDEYGCSEVGSISHECPKRRLHVMADNLIAEVLRDDGTVADSGFGELIVTDLTNELTPVIRYRVGDFCELQPAATCPCGLPFPTLANILGRVEDAVTLPDGVRHHPAKICYLVDEVDRPFKAIRQYQVVQTEPAAFELRVVAQDPFPQEEFENRALQVFERELRHRLRIHVRRVPTIAREPTGKYRLVVARPATGRLHPPESSR